MPKRVWLPWAVLMTVALWPAHAARADARDAWRQAMQIAARGDDARAAAMLEGAAQTLNAGAPWRHRMQTAGALLRLRSARMHPPADAASRLLARLPANALETRLIRAWLARHPAPPPASPWVAGVLSALAPGAGHAWLGRWRDAAAAAGLAWPMMLLAGWAWRRRMGPVTVFFTLLALWLWSGVVFSSVSLAERGSAEAWLHWWRGLWQASGLPGRPW